MIIMLNMAVLLLKWHQIQNIYLEVPKLCLQSKHGQHVQNFKNLSALMRKMDQCSFSPVDSYNTDRWPNILLFTNSKTIYMSMPL
jgi:hypothetical protein